jgi:hypothetical protein
MKGWRLVVAAGLLAGSAMVARPVSASDEYGTGDKYATGDEYAASEAAPSEDVWSQVGWGALTGLSNLLYFPAKLVYAGLGGLTGGLALGLTGGDMGTAESIWEPSLKGDYFLTPSMVQGQDPISFAGGTPGLTGAAPLPDDPAGSAPPPDQNRDS